MDVWIMLIAGVLALLAVAFVILKAALRARDWDRPDLFPEMHRPARPVIAKEFGKLCDQAPVLLSQVLQVRKTLEDYRIDPNVKWTALSHLQSVKITLPEVYTITPSYRPLKSIVEKVVAAVGRINDNIAKHLGHNQYFQDSDVQRKLEAVCLGMIDDIDVIVNQLKKLAEGGHGVNLKENSDALDRLEELKRQAGYRAAN